MREPVPSIPSRILVYGIIGSGKSVLAERIGIAMNVPWYSVDDLTWEPDWVPVPVTDQRRPSRNLEEPGMTATPDLEPAAHQLIDLLPGVSEDQLSAPTPCAEYTVGDLLDHFMGLTVEFRKAATKSAGKPEGDVGVAAHESRRGAGCAANLDPDWRRQLPLQLNELVAAWRDPAAWEGTTEAGGVTLPADMMGRVALNELVLHGWDLARGTGQPFEADPSSAEVSFEFTSAMSAPGEEASREGLFGPVVAVPPDAPLFHHVLGLSGRDPSWTPS